MTAAPVYPGPNAEVLEAQVRVCTGPHQSRPLGNRGEDPQPERVLELILSSLRGELRVEEQVSDAQMGAFFAAMSIRKTFEAGTNWNDLEHAAFERYGEALRRELPPHIRLLMDPSSATTTVRADGDFIRWLKRILAGEHLSYEETRLLCEAILGDRVAEGLKAAAVIGQRMNIENYEEVRGYLDATLPAEEVMRVAAPSLTHFGEPFDGSARYFRPTLFVAAVRAACGSATVLHGVDELPPKRGLTDEQILRELGARTDLSRQQAVTLLEDERVGFAYVSQHQYAPQAYRLRELRSHIAKRPPWATTEKAQQLFACDGANHMVVGFYHVGYEEKLLHLMKQRDFDTGLVIKGEEGSTNYSLRLGMPSTPERKAINYTQGFRRRAGSRFEEFAADVNPGEYGFDYDQNPRPEQVSAASFAAAGMAALQGKGEKSVVDRIVLNAAMIDFWLGICADEETALKRAFQAIADGSALDRLNAYVGRSVQV
jgi:anthranilate phosphoribosyltransferase